jgi:protein-tyrosine phosphatase
MPFEPIKHPTDAKQEASEVSANTALPSSPVSSEEDLRPRVSFSVLRWISTGVLRVFYRRWTRIAAHLFPEDSKGERLAQALHIPLPDTLNMSWVDEHLAVGGRIHPEDIRALGRTGIRHVVDTRAEHCDDREALARENIELLYLPTPDTYPLSIGQLMQGTTWVNERLDKGESVLIHCEHGVGRSVLLTCAVLVARGMHASAALELVQRKRWQAAPNHQQIVRLREFEAKYVSRDGHR